MRSALDAIRVLKMLQLPNERLLLILNRATASRVALGQVARFFGPTPEVVVPCTPPFDDAAEQRTPLVMTAPQHVGSVLMRDLAARITMAAPVKD